mgnify:CR=1 FL=1
MCSAGLPTPPPVSEPKKHKRLRIVSVHASTLMGRLVLVFRCNRTIQSFFSGNVDEMMRWSWDFLHLFCPGRGIAAHGTDGRLVKSKRSNDAGGGTKAEFGIHRPFSGKDCIPP